MQFSLSTGRYLFVGIVAMQLVSLCVDGEVPYFPIEVSRTAASHYASLVLTCVVAALPFVMACDGNLSVGSHHFVAYSGLVVIVLFDDVKYYTLHGLGVLLLALSALVSAIDIKRARLKKNKLKLLVVPFVVYITRIILKVTIVWFLEIQEKSHYIPTSLSDLANIVERCRNVGYHGCHPSYDGCEYPYITTTTFKLAAVGQWVVFYYLFKLFK